MATNSTAKATVKKVALIKDYRLLRVTLDLSQTEFWGRLGITQSAGSRYESGRNPCRPVAVLAHLVYVKKQEIDARGFK